MADKAGEMYYDLDLRLGKFQKSLQSIEKNTRMSSKRMAKGTKVISDAFGKIASKVIGLTALWRTMQGAIDLQKQAAVFNQSVQAMENQFKVSSDVIISELTKVSQGTVATKDIVNAANKSMALGVTKDVGEMAKLMEFARLRGKAMGITTTQAFNDLSTGIGRQSPLILDNLGIIVKGLAGEAKAAGVAYDSQFLLNAVLKQAGEELEKAGPQALTYAEKMAKIKATADNVKIALGNTLNTGLKPFIDKLSMFSTDSVGFTTGMRKLSAGLVTVIEVFSIVIKSVQIFAKMIKAAASTIIRDVTMLSFKVVEAARDLSETQFGKKMGLDSDKLNTKLTGLSKTFQKAKKDADDSFNISAQTKSIETSVNNIGAAWKNVNSNIEDVNENIEAMAKPKKTKTTTTDPKDPPDPEKIIDTFGIMTGMLEEINGLLFAGNEEAQQLVGGFIDLGKAIKSQDYVAMFSSMLQLIIDIGEALDNTVTALEKQANVFNKMNEGIEKTNALIQITDALAQAFGEDTEAANKLLEDRNALIGKNNKSLADGLKAQKEIAEAGAVAANTEAKRIQNALDKLPKAGSIWEAIGGTGKARAALQAQLDNQLNISEELKTQLKLIGEQNAALGLNEDGTIKDLEAFSEMILLETDEERLKILEEILDNHNLITSEMEEQADIQTSMIEQLNTQLESMKSNGLFDEENIYQAEGLNRIATAQGLGQAERMELAQSLNLSDMAAQRVVNVGSINQEFNGSESEDVDQTLRLTTNALLG